MSKPEDRRAAVPPRLVDEILDEQRRRWGQGERILVETYLQQLPTLGSDSCTILDLIYNEIVLREKAGERPEQQEYAQRFPNLSAELALQFEVDGGLDWQLAADASVLHDAHNPKPTREPSGGTPYPSLRGYAIERPLGRGATGVVYKARLLSQDRSVAVKVVLAGMRQQGEALAQLRAEAARLAGLRHLHLCPIHEIGLDAGRLFIAQERVEGSLAKRQADAPVTPLQAAQWLETLARTVHDIHRQGVVHGNLTPANVLMSYNGILKITDIGLARFVDPVLRQGVAAIWHCRAPEQVQGNRDAIGPPGDVYGLGSILFTLVTGHPPFPGATTQGMGHEELTPPSQLRPDLPRDLETICLHCLHPEPGERYSSALALAEDLTAFLAGKPIRARRAGFIERVVRSMRRWCVLAGKAWSTARTRRLLQTATQQRLRAERIQLALDLTCRMMRITGRDELVRLLAETTAWLTDAELVTIFLVDWERGGLRAQITRGTGVEELRLPLGAGIAGTVATTNAPINLADANDDPRLDPETDRRAGTKTRNLLALPLTSGDGAVRGVVQAINKRDGAFNAADMEVLSPLFGAAAIAIERTE